LNIGEAVTKKTPFWKSASLARFLENWRKGGWKVTFLKSQLPDLDFWNIGEKVAEKSPFRKLASWGRFLVHWRKGGWKVTFLKASFLRSIPCTLAKRWLKSHLSEKPASWPWFLEQGWKGGLNLKSPLFTKVLEQWLKRNLFTSAHAQWNLKHTVLEFHNNLWGARNRVVIGLSYRPARLRRLAESILWNRFLDSLKV
jgi:hypothetical protein